MVMSTFAIQRGATPLCVWDLSTEAGTFHPRTVHRDGMMILEESSKVAFVLDPVPEGTEYRISVGDVSLSDLVPRLEDAAGVALSGRLLWRELAYFESARGRTNIVLEARSDVSQHSRWETVLIVAVYVLPSKLGEARYESMADDLETLSRSLLVDLYGKSVRCQDVRFGMAANRYQSHERALAAIRKALAELGPLLGTIAQRPASKVHAVPNWQRYWGSERLSPSAITALSRRAAIHSMARRPITIRTQRRVESFDIPEHRTIHAFLNILQRRAEQCERAASGHIRAIKSERDLRHVQLVSGPTLYERVDLPRIGRLHAGAQKARQSSVLSGRLATLPFLREAKPELLAARGGAFQRSSEYRAVLNLIRRFLLANSVWCDGYDMSAVAKLTSRLFEQWCYLQTVEAFRACGLELREWSDALRKNLRSRFVLDFDRGLMFEGALGSNLRIRFRYEPWILGEESAAKAGETLCRKSGADVAWCPDIVIECLHWHGGTWHPVYGIVLDCKYVPRIRDQHWLDTRKYLQIRSTETNRQIVKQLWLIAPGNEPTLASEDPGVTFTERGPSCESGEYVQFQIGASSTHNLQECDGFRRDFSV